MSKNYGLLITVGGIILIIVTFVVGHSIDEVSFTFLTYFGMFLVIGGLLIFTVSIKNYKERKKRLVNEDPLIEVYSPGKKGKNKLEGYVDKNFNFLGSNKKLWASIENDVILFWNKEPVFYLKNNEAIYDYNNELMGSVKKFRIFDKQGILLYILNKTSGEIEDNNGRIRYVLKGNLDAIDHLTFVGFAFVFMDLFC